MIKRRKSDGLVKISKTTDEIWTIFGLTKPKRYDIINTVVRERQQKLKNRIDEMNEWRKFERFLKEGMKITSEKIKRKTFLKKT